ncbi:DUF5333 domain-containing protein [Salipiger sp. P9]|uniref:DUF5333 domain-containing protein n=1 Tax=Salipiger pentaromativorans TaxID=2943193 RepID=UPI0021589324|nr:DUF5333 domain-containing protein [Salipiger pentaromativorans]MCR8546260.1 DUF5333 domain-containing protein [Salipiger pentaromativorans]
MSLRYVLPAAFALLAACQSTTGAVPASNAPARGATLAERWEQRVVTLSVAERIADQCYAQGISLAPAPWNGAVTRATEELAAAGADRAALSAIYANHDFNSSAAQAEAYLMARGAMPDVPESLCAVGEAEMAQGSDVGRALQKL